MSQRLFNSCNTLSMGFTKNKNLFLFCSLIFSLLISFSFQVKAQGDSHLDFHNINVGFSQDLGDGIAGEGNYKIMPLNDEITEVHYSFMKKAMPNPYEVSYQYNIYNKEGGSFEMDLKSAIEPLEMRIDESVEVKYSGDKLAFPSELKIGDSLADATGYFALSLKSGKNFLNMKVKVENRKITKTEIIEIDGFSKEAYVVSYNYTLEKYNPFDQMIQKSEQTVQDWIIPGLGIVKQDREGSSIHGIDDDSAGTVYFKNHKTHLNTIQQN